MQTIAQILKFFNTLSTYIYIFTVNIEPLTFLKEITSEINELVNDCFKYDDSAKLNDSLLT